MHDRRNLEVVSTDTSVKSVCCGGTIKTQNIYSYIFEMYNVLMGLILREEVVK
jgi:hypothetical protein